MQQLKGVLQCVSFPTTITANIDDWLQGHAAFVVPIAFALYRVETDASRLAADSDTLRLMVRATREAFQVLRADGKAETPANLRTLCLRLPTAFAVRYWRRVPAGPRGKLWYAAHTRAAPEEMRPWPANCTMLCAELVDQHPTS